jgi:hypothetical protein
MKVMKRKIQIQNEHRIMSFAPESLRQEEDSENYIVDMTWSAGARVLKRPWFSEAYIEELVMDEEACDLERLNTGAPLLNNHDNYSLSDVMGTVVRGSAKIENGEGTCSVMLSKREEIAGLVQDIRDGIISKVSVGYRINEMEIIEADEDKGEMMIRRATKWEPFEVSFVTIPADNGAESRSSINKETHECLIIERRENMDEDKKTEDKKVVAPQVDAEAVRKEAAEAEKTRITQITLACRKLNASDEEREKFIDENVSADEVRKVLIDKKEDEEMENNTSSVVTTTDSQESSRKEAFQAALMHRTGLEKELADGAREFRGMSLMESARTLLGASGLSRQELAQRAISTSDFAEVLGNVANKSLRKAYDLQQQTFRPFVRFGTLPDYKEASRIAFGEAPSLELVQENGEYKSGAMGEKAEKVKLSKYGKIISITDETIINDDMDAFSRLPGMFSASAARLESNLVYGTLTGNPVMADGVALFHATHKNLGTAGTIDDTSLTEVYEMMMVQKGIDDQDFLNLTPEFLVCGPKMQAQAKKYLANISAAKASDVNLYSAELKLIVDPRISDKSWFVTVSPSQVDTIEVSYLEGMSGPEMTRQYNFNKDSIDLKLKHVVGVKAIDHVGLVKNAGL